MRVVTVIPARYDSKRFPGKPLQIIQGKPMIQWVYERASRARGVDDTIVATDDERIVKEVQRFGGKVEMTSAHHTSGTDRIAELAMTKLSSADVLINVQGDEPLIDPSTIEATLKMITTHSFEMSSAMTEFRNEKDIHLPQAVKVLVDQQYRAIYFSRFPIPYSQKLASKQKEVSLSAPFVCFRHVGIYAYKRSTLLKLSERPPSTYEMEEGLEQLRALQAGIAIGMAKVNDSSLGVDTPEDLKKVEYILSQERTS